MLLEGEFDLCDKILFACYRWEFFYWYIIKYCLQDIPMASQIIAVKKLYSKIKTFRKGTPHKWSKGDKLLFIINSLLWTISEQIKLIESFVSLKMILFVFFVASYGTQFHCGILYKFNKIPYVLHLASHKDFRNESIDTLDSSKYHVSFGRYQSVERLEIGLQARTSVMCLLLLGCTK